MSRAFVKEDSDAPPPPPLERPISGAPNRVTVRGAQLIEDEILALEAAIVAAREDTEIESLRRDLRYWAARRATAQIIPANRDPTAVGFGTRVTIRRGGSLSEIDIVGEDEADPAEGRIAWTSPLARALEEAEAGETVELEAGGATEPIEVVSVSAMSGEENTGESGP